MASRFWRSKRVLVLLICTLFIIKIGFDLFSHTYFGLRYASTILSPTQFLYTSFFKASNAVLSNHHKGLPLVRMYLPEKAQHELIAAPPGSTKQWKKGFISFEDNKLRKVKIRHRGENIRNYVHQKKSWKIKLPRKKIYNRERIFNYVLPRAEILRDVIPYWLAEEIGQTTPRAKLVELFLNDKSHGVMLELEQPDENFLRNSGFMPVNLYKGEIEEEGIFKGPYTHDLMNNLSSWSKQATNNFYIKDDKTDLINFLELIQKANVDFQDYKKLVTIAPYNEWVKFAVFQELVQSWHNARYGNIRLISDNWKGAITPFPWDTTYKYTDGEPIIDRGSHELLNLYLRTSDFLLMKYKLLYSELKNNSPLEKVATRLNEIEPLLKRSLDRDAHFKAWAATTHGFYDHNSSAEEERRQIRDSLYDLHNKLLGLLNEKPDLIWAPYGKHFSIILGNHIPVTDISIKFENNIHQNKSSDDLPRFWFDRNMNGVADEKDVLLPHHIEGDQFVLNASFLANRLRQTTNKLSVHNSEKLDIQKTRFPIITNIEKKVYSIQASNAINGKVYTIPKSISSGYHPHKFNLPIILEPEKTMVSWKGDIEIRQNLEVDYPVTITAGTSIKLAPKTSVVFRNKLYIQGTKERPVTITPLADAPWGTFALQGQQTTGSRIKHLHLSKGSGAEIGNIRYSGMFSVHDTKDIKINGLNIRENKIHDDMVHIIYSQDIAIINSRLEKARSDAIDIDISQVTMDNIVINNSGNDAVDFMDSTAEANQIYIDGAGDKGFSVGEGSKAFITNSVIRQSKIGIESKDSSVALVYHTDFIDNDIQLSAYRKNWRYGDGGTIEVNRSYLTGQNNEISLKKKSKIILNDSAIYPPPKSKKRVRFSETVDFTPSRKVKGIITDMTTSYKQLVEKYVPKDPAVRGAPQQ